VLYHSLKRVEANLVFWGIAELQGGSINSIPDELNSYRDATPIME
jgi:hypothetical protein